MKKKCLLSEDIYDYHYVSQGKTTVPSIDDNEDLEFTHDAFNILHFSDEETWNIYKIVSCVMHMGEMVMRIKQLCNLIIKSDIRFVYFSE